MSSDGATRLALRSLRVHELRRDVSVDRALTFVAAGAALGVYLFRLAETSLWGDEAFTVGIVSNTWPVFWKSLWTIDGNMSLYDLILRGWLAATSALRIAPDEVVVRVPSVVFGVLGVVAVFWLGRRFWGRTVGALGAVLYLLNILQLGAAREARSYSLQMLLICVGWYALLCALEARERRARWWAAYAVAMTLACYAHLFTGLVVAAQVTAFAAILLVPNAWRESARRSIRAMVAAWAAIGIGIIPLVAYAVHKGSTNAFVPPASVWELARVLWQISGRSIVFGMLLGVAVLLAATFTLRAWRQAGRGTNRSFAPTMAALCWLVVPLGASYAVTQPGLNLHLFAPTYLIVVVPAICLLAAVGTAMLRSVHLQGLLATGLLIGAALGVQTFFSAPPLQDFRTAARWIDERAQSGDGLVCTSSSCSLTLEYYSRLDGRLQQLTADSPSLWSWSDGGERRLEMHAIAEYAASRRRIFLVDSILGGDSADMKAQAEAAHSWLENAGVRLEETSVPSTNGPVRVWLYSAEQSAR